VTEALSAVCGFKARDDLYVSDLKVGKYFRTSTQKWRTGLNDFSLTNNLVVEAKNIIVKF